MFLFVKTRKNDPFYFTVGQ